MSSRIVSSSARVASGAFARRAFWRNGAMGVYENMPTDTGFYFGIDLLGHDIVFRGTRLP